MSEVQQEQAPVALKNKQLIIYLFAGAIIAVAGFFGYTELYQKPLEAKAADAMYVAEKYFANDSSELVLNGDGTSKGVLYIIKEFSGTKAANLAKYYAGMSYYRLKDYNKAIAIDPQDAKAYYNRGIAKSALGDMLGACFDFKRANSLGNQSTAQWLKSDRGAWCRTMP